MHGRTVPALTFTANRDHPRYAGAVAEDEAAAVIAAASGRLGSCADYLLSTADHLATLGLADPYIEDLASRVRAIQGEPEGRHRCDPVIPKV
jgi:cation transport protein ChaC